jgi:hypothetical protein
MSEIVSTEALASYLLLSARRIQQLSEEGILRRAFDSEAGQEVQGRYVLKDSVNGYINFLRLGQGADSIEKEYQAARAKRMAAVAEEAEIKLRRTRREYHHAKDIEFVMTQMLTACKQRLLALPSRCCHSLQAKTNPAEIAGILRDEVEAALRELSEYDPAKFEAANEKYLSHVVAAGSSGFEAQ